MILIQPLLEPERIELEPLPTAVVRRPATTMADIRELFDSGFAALAATGITPGGPAFAIYRGDPMGLFDAEIGFPVAAPLSRPIDGTPTVYPSVLPAGPALALSHLGSYETLEQTWGQLIAAAVKHAGAPGSTYLEFYVTEPSPDADPDAMRTDLVLPISE